jgi:hypothetical protein
VLLETVPVYRLADIFVASFEISFEEQLSMLDSVDLKVRLSKATELVDRHLQVKIPCSLLFDGYCYFSCNKFTKWIFFSCGNSPFS